jgi:GT2 family glycosyltransferase
MPIHNEAEYLPDCLKSLKTIEDEVFEFIFVLDRCTDNSEDVVKQYFPDAIFVKKKECKWKHSLAENYQIGFKMAQGEIICTHDADATSPQDIHPLLIALSGNVASVSAEVVTWKKASFLNRIYYYWEKTHKFAPFGEEPRGAFRLIRKDVIEQVGGFKDVSAQETVLDIEMRKAGFQSIMVKGVISFHLRRISLRKSIQTQISSGRARREFKVPLWMVFGHAVIRLRPFVLYGYLLNKKDDLQAACSS